MKAANATVLATSMPHTPAANGLVQKNTLERSEGTGYTGRVVTA